MLSRSACLVNAMFSYGHYVRAQKGKGGQLMGNKIPATKGDVNGITWRLKSYR